MSVIFTQIDVTSRTSEFQDAILYTEKKFINTNPFYFPLLSHMSAVTGPDLEDEGDYCRKLKSLAV